jgi:GTP-binding protein
MFVDEIIVKFKAGKGGDGSKSFLHLPHLPKGGPDGGDGGKGGSIYLVGNPNLESLQSFNHKKSFEAENGEYGLGRKKHGKNAEDLYVHVPIGTEVIEINPKNDQEYLLFEVSTPKEHLLVKGGRGGWGNVHFASPTNQAPKFAVPGQAGEEKTVKLNLKMIADVGLIGLPNAGKSTLLSVISDARPKIADYAFTTLEPNLGVVHGQQKNLIVADLPGLIEGASSGKGLGLKFLKHIEKTKIVVHLIDINSDDIDRDYRLVRHELESYSRALKEKPEIVVLSKADTKPESAWPKTNLKYDLAISAAAHQNLEQLIKLLEQRTSD